MYARIGNITVFYIEFNEKEVHLYAKDSEILTAFVDL